MGHRITDQQWAVARDVLAAGFSVKEAEKYSGISQPWLWEHFPRRNQRTIKADIPTYYRAKELLEVEGVSYNEAARTTGISSRALRRYFPDSGWERSGRQGSEFNAMQRALEKVGEHYA